MNEQNKKLGVFSVRRVKEFSFTINEALHELNKPVRIQFQHLTHYIDNDFVSLTLRVYYSYPDNPESILVDLHVQNLFEVPNLSQYRGSDNEFIFPKDLIIAIVSMSISHTRSLLAKSTSGTLYQESLLPIVNSADVAKSFFPNMFPEEIQPDPQVVGTKIYKKRKKKE